MIGRYFPYRHLRQQHGAAIPTALLLSLLHGLAWLLLRLESPAWQALLSERRYWYPQLAGKPASLGDPLRYLIQSCWLLLVRPATAETPLRQLHRRPAPAWLSAATQALRQARQHFWRTVEQLPGRMRQLVRQRGHNNRLRFGRRSRQLGYALLGLLAAALALLSITEPFAYLTQLIFVLLLLAVALLVRRMPGRFPVLLLIILSVIVSCRYLWWRYTSTLNWNSKLDLALGLILLAAETFSWLVLMLGYLQTSWPLQRKPAQLPDNPEYWPVVDLYIPTYNEDLAIVRTTVYAALGLDWPRDRLRIYLLDDGRRESFRRFADEAGIGYIARPDNRHAKAGNLNYALQRTSGELVAIFDCDHVPVRSFLQLTVGWFLRDTKLALVQTPHHFFSPDPFERNLGIFRRQPNEGELFYGLVQDGNDLWNAAFFCGSCAILRRSALDEIGGFAVETVTEDAHTALRLHRHGWSSAYLRIPQAAGLATESLSAHIGQRIRWARGMAQIFRTDNPLLGKGLSLFQRICYTNAMLHFLAGLPRLIFLTAPLAFLLLHAYIIYAPALMILLYVLPHMIHASLANSRQQGQFRRTFWGEVYETVLAWYIARPTTVALLNPSKGRFNVTEKGGLLSENQLDWKISRPYLVLAALNLAGLAFASWRLLHGPANEIGTVIVSSLWVLYNLLIIGTALAISAEVRQVRRSHRVQARLPASLRLANGHSHPCALLDYSSDGAQIELTAPLPLPLGVPVTLVLYRGQREYTFTGQVSRSHGLQLGLYFGQQDLQQRIDFVQCTFARADAWLSWNQAYGQDQLLRSFTDVLKLGGRGYYRLYQYAPPWLNRLLRPFRRFFVWLRSFLPRVPASPTLSSRLVSPS